MRGYECDYLFAVCGFVRVAFLDMPRANSSSALRRRLLSGVGAYGYAQVVTIAIQLISLPLYLLIWDVATYGSWIVLSAVPFYLSLADGGVSTASGNRMIALVAQGKSETAGVVFQSAVAFLVAVSLVILTILALVLFLIPESLFLTENWQLVLLLLSSSVLLGLFCSLSESIYKATNGYAVGTYLVTTGRLVEWVGGISGLFVFSSFLGVAATALFARAAYTLFAMWCSQRRTPYLKWGIRNAERNEIRQAAAPGLMFLTISLTNALSLQGFTILVAVTLGPIATAIFNTYRTIARLVVQLVGALSNPLWPELTSLHSRGDAGRFWQLYRKAVLLGLAIAAGGSIAVFIASPYILSFWTRGKISFDVVIVGLFMLYAAVNAAWQIPRVVLLALNRHAGLAWKGVAVAVLSLGIASIAFRYGGISAIVISMILGEALMWLVCSREVRQLLKTGLQE